MLQLFGISALCSLLRVLMEGGECVSLRFERLVARYLVFDSDFFAE